MSKKLERMAKINRIIDKIKRDRSVGALSEFESDNILEGLIMLHNKIYLEVYK